MRSYRSYQEKRAKIAGKIIIGIDPGKARHHAVIIDADGLPLGKQFSFSVSNNRFRNTLTQKIDQQLTSYPNVELLFAVETSCNLWQTLRLIDLPVISFFFESNQKISDQVNKEPKTKESFGGEYEQAR